MTSNTQKKWRYNFLRRVVLTGSFLLIVVNPLFVFYFDFSFIQGWYQSLGIGNLWFVSPLEGLERFLVTRSLHVPILVGMLLPLLLAFLLGRVFCSWICPISFFNELFESVRRKISKKKYLRDRLVLSRKILWYALVGEIVLSMIIGMPLFVFLSPPGLVGREAMMLVFFHKVALEGVIVLVVVSLECVTRRMYCRYFCPLGALLALVGSRRKMVVIRQEEQCTECRRCDLVCPMGIKPSSGESLSSYCWNCGECVDCCRENALAFTWRGATRTTF